MPLPHVYCCAREEARNGSQRYKTRQVSDFPLQFKESLGSRMHSIWPLLTVLPSSDCPEAEATYIITDGGIADPEK